MVVAISQFSSALNISLKATIANDLGEVAYFLQQNWGTGMTSGTGSGAGRAWPFPYLSPPGGERSTSERSEEVG